MRFPVAVQLYSVRDDMAADFEGTLKKVKEMGYDGVEFAGLFGNAPADVKALCAQIGLVPISAHVSYDEIAADPEAVIGDYAEIGCKFIVIPYATEERRPGGEKYDETLAGIRQFAEIAKRYGMRVLYHNHDFEFQKLDGEYLLDLLYAALPADVLQTQLDTCWVNYGGEDPVKYIKKYADRAPLVHLKDFYATGKAAKAYALIGIDDGAQTAEPADDAFELRPCGSGMQDMPAILKACEEAKTEWVIVEQDDPSMGKTPLECIKASIDYINTINN